MQLGPDCQSFINWVDVVVSLLVSIPELRDEEKARLELSYLGYQRQHRDERLKSLAHVRLESSEEGVRKLSGNRIHTREVTCQ